MSLNSSSSGKAMSSYISKTHMASASADTNELYRTDENHNGLKTVHTKTLIRKTTTITKGDKRREVSKSSLPVFHLFLSPVVQSTSLRNLFKTTR